MTTAPSANGAYHSWERTGVLMTTAQRSQTPLDWEQKARSAWLLRVPWLSLLKLMAPNDTRAWNSGLAPSAHGILEPPHSRAITMCTHVTQPSPAHASHRAHSTQLLCGLGDSHQTSKRKRVNAYAYTKNVGGGRPAQPWSLKPFCLVC